jgi:hypothetical protein
MKLTKARKRKMRTKHSRRNVATVLTIIASLALLSLTSGHSLANNICRPDQTQLQNQGAIQLGGRVVLAQTFIPSAAGHRVCRVKLIITKNFPGAGNLTLHLLRSNFTELDVAVTIPGAAIPMGTSVQVFDFGCNGAALAGMPFYGLKLESAGSPFGAYSWKGVGGDVYVKPGAGGRGWRKTSAGVGSWTNLGAWDYAFEIYLCD